MKHHKAKAPFSDVELASTLYEQGATPRLIADYMEVSINTLWDWLRFKTRINK